MIALGVLIFTALLVYFWRTPARNSNADWWVWYNAYLRSPEWKRKRLAVLLRSGGKCERCGRFGSLTVHHISYRNTPNELPWDLAALCYDCHKAQHPGKKF